MNRRALALGVAGLIAVLVIAVVSGEPESAPQQPPAKEMTSHESARSTRPDYTHEELIEPPRDELTAALESHRRDCATDMGMRGGCSGRTCALLWEDMPDWEAMRWAAKHPQVALEVQGHRLLDIPLEATACGRARSELGRVVSWHYVTSLPVVVDGQETQCTVLATGGRSAWPAVPAHDALLEAAALCDGLLGRPVYVEAVEAQSLMLVSAARELPVGHVIERADLDARPIYNDLFAASLHFIDADRVVGRPVVRYPVGKGDLVTRYFVDP